MLCYTLSAIDQGASFMHGGAAAGGSPSTGPYQVCVVCSNKLFVSHKAFRERSLSYPPRQWAGTVQYFSGKVGSILDSTVNWWNGCDMWKIIPCGSGTYMGVAKYR